MSENGRGSWGKFAHVGLGVKRWLLLWALGVGIIAVGAASAMSGVLESALPGLLSWRLEGAAIALIGGACVAGSVYGLIRSVGPLSLSAPRMESLTGAVNTRRRRSLGPRIVTLGGGKGMSALLRGLKEHTDNISAIVTVGDDGGSSGRLRQSLGMPPPGDFRNCLIALSEDETLVRELFQYRFERGEELAGHSFGNLLIGVMTDITGSFEAALEESSRLLAVRGRILPATTANVSLSARLSNGAIVDGESSIGASDGAVDELSIRPEDVRAVPAAVQAIRAAELVVIGPGSLYTSILPNLLVRDIQESIRAARAPKVYVCNVATQRGETKRYAIADHVEAIQNHTSVDLIDIVIANNGAVEPDERFSDDVVVDDGRSIEFAELLLDDLIDAGSPTRHDAAKLAECIIDVYHGSASRVAPDRRRGGAAMIPRANPRRD